MTKFGKHFKQNFVSEWQDEYINYKRLKRFIRESRESIKDFPLSYEDPLIKSDNYTEDVLISKIERRDSQFLQVDTPVNSFIIEKSNLDLMSTNLHGSILKSFTETLDSEIKKMYQFYCNIERELYLQINTRLHRRINYDRYTYSDINKELDCLMSTSHITFLFCKYLNDNMTAIRKILKKFDKNFKKQFGLISVNYLKRKLEQANSDLSYILKCKILDEVCILVEDLVKDLKKKLMIINRNSLHKKAVSSIDVRVKNNNLTEDLVRSSNALLNSYDNSSFITNEKENSELKKKINKKFKELAKYLKEIDESQILKAKIKDGDSFLKRGDKIQINSTLVRAEAHRSMMISEEEEILNKFLPQNRSIGQLGSENITNIVLSMFHTFAYMLLYTINLPTNSEFLKQFNQDEEDFSIYSGFLMGMTPLGSLFSLIIYTKYFKEFKLPFISSITLFILGSLLYSLAYDFKLVWIAYLGRFLIGLGSARTLTRKYLVQFIPKSVITRYTFIYLLVSILGLISGLLVSFSTLYFDEEKFGEFTFNVFTYPGWISLIICVSLILLFIFFFTEPKEGFSILEDDGQLPYDNKHILTSEEKVMINELDDKLNIINNQNNFSDTNLVHVHIENIKQTQVRNFGYISKCFLVLFCCLFAVRLISESILVIFPFHMLSLNYSFNFICLYMAGSFALVIPGTLLFKQMANNIKERKVLLYLLIICLCFSLLIIDRLVSSEYVFCVMFTLLLIVTNLVESFASFLLNKVIPVDWTLGNMNTGLLITVSSTVGKILGAFLLSISILVGRTESILSITYGFCTILLGLISLLFIFNYSELRVKALARLLKSSKLNKV